MVDSQTADAPAGRSGERFGLTFLLGSGSFLLFAAAQVLAMNQRDWFGLDPRKAGNNFVFNFTFLFPAILLASLLAWASYAFYVRSLIAVNRGSRILTKRKAAAILPALPVMGQVMIILMQIIAALLLAL